MKYNLLKFLQTAFPFLLTIGLWRCAHPIWNPGGILAIIPIFYCSFVRPTQWFPLFSVIMCICLDYNFETVCFWLAIYCFCCAVDGFQNWIDITHVDHDAFVIFAFVVLCAILMQIIANFTWVNIAKGMWIILVMLVMYKPCVWMIKKVQK